jgi:NAD(P)-dependent dehydrogenase (short-subunit alcohol dehydrogenase family)
MFDFKDKAIMVAGGAGYLSIPACRGLALHGAKLVIADIDAERAKGCAAKLREEVPGSKISAVALDIGDEKSIANAVQLASEQLGKIDVLIIATYLSIGDRVEELSAADLDRALHVNVTGSFLLARAVVERMKSGGSIILFSSMYGQIAPDPRNYPSHMKPNPIEYGVSKAAIEQMIRYLAVHWAPRNIRVNGIAPGAFPHPQQQKDDPAWMQTLGARAPMARIGRQEEVAGAMLYLASDEASFVTGHVLNVDGGWTIW